MKIDNLVNRVLRRAFGTNKDGDGKVHFCSHNLNEDSQGRPKGLPWQGRWFVYSGSRPLHHFEWHLRKNWRAGFSLSTDPEDDGLSWSVSNPLMTLYLSHRVPGGLRKLIDTPFWRNWNQKTGGYEGSHVYTELYIIDVHYTWMDGHRLAWNLLKFDWGWSKKMPKWMEGSIHPVDVLFGRTDYSSESLSKHEVAIPMPEGQYPATVEFKHNVWKRKRLPWNSDEGTYASINMKIGIPFEGKGESGYDCGEDALYGLHRKCSTLEGAIAATVESVLQSRRKYNGNINAVYPPPAPKPPTTPPDSQDLAQSGS